MTTPEDVDKAFSKGGIMEMVVRLKQEGVLRKVGFSAHSGRPRCGCWNCTTLTPRCFP